jgi:RNA polymerase sigma-70 factor (ECF subfamily)
MNTTPVSLLERLCDPGAEQAAWERFVELFTPLLFSWSRQLGLRAEDAADLVQDVFTTLLQELPRFAYDKHRSFRAWLRTVLRNRWRDTCRRRAVLPVRQAGAPLPDVASPDPIAHFDDTEYRGFLAKRAFAVMQSEFEPVTCTAFRENVINCRPAAEVAAELGITRNAVYLAKARVLRRLREELDGLID